MKQTTVFGVMAAGVHRRRRGLYGEAGATSRAARIWEPATGTPVPGSPWRNPALHRERRGARLTRREEGAYWAYGNRGLQAVRPNNAVRRDASPLECSGDFRHGLPGPKSGWKGGEGRKWRALQDSNLRPPGS